MWTIGDLKKKGNYFFRLNYWPTVLVSLIFLVISQGLSFSSTNVTRSIESTELSGFMGLWVLAFIPAALIGIAVSVGFSVFLANPIEVGICGFMYRNHREKANISIVFSQFSGNYMNVVKVMFFKNLYTFLWSLLFMVPGIIKSYEYRMVPYILSESPEISVDDALRISSVMMDGHKGHAFGLDLSFIGWQILNAFTVGILGIFYVNPYVNMTNAALYETLRQNYFANAKSTAANNTAA